MWKCKEWWYIRLTLSIWCRPLGMAWRPAYNTWNLWMIWLYLSLEVRSVFLDISKAFDKVWHEGRLYKLKTMSISGELHKLLENYISSRIQKGCFKWSIFIVETCFGRCSTRINFGSAPFSNLHLWFTKWNEVQCKTLCWWLTSVFTVVKDKNESANVLNNDLIIIFRWAYNWKMLFNPDPNKPAQEVIFSRKKQFQSHPTKS